MWNGHEQEELQIKGESVSTTYFKRRERAVGINPKVSKLSFANQHCSVVLRTVRNVKLYNDA